MAEPPVPQECLDYITRAWATNSTTALDAMGKVGITVSECVLVVAHIHEQNYLAIYSRHRGSPADEIARTLDLNAEGSRFIHQSVERFAADGPEAACMIPCIAVFRTEQSQRLMSCYISPRPVGVA